MDEIIKYKRAAPVVYGPRLPPLGERAVIAHRTRAGVLDAAQRRVRAGEIEPLERGTVLRFEDGIWMLDVRLKPLTAAEMRGPLLTRGQRVGVAAGLSLVALLGAGWWLAMSLSAAALLTLLAAALVSLAVAVRASTTVNIQQNNYIGR